MKPWQRPHGNIHAIFSTPICEDCGRIILTQEEADSPCPARNVKLSDNPEAVRMLKSLGHIWRGYAKQSPQSGWAGTHADLMEDAIRAAVRAYQAEGKESK